MIYRGVTLAGWLRLSLSWEKMEWRRVVAEVEEIELDGDYGMGGRSADLSAMRARGGGLRHRRAFGQARRR